MNLILDLRVAQTHAFEPREIKRPICWISFLPVCVLGQLLFGATRSILEDFSRLDGLHVTLGDHVARAACCRSSVFVFVVRFLNVVVLSAGHRTRTRRAHSNGNLQRSLEVLRLYVCMCVL